MAAEASTDAGMAGRGRMAAVWRRRAQAVRRLGWGVADQAVSSLTNFAVSIYVVRELGAVQFGAFSLAYVTYAFALTASRGLATDPLLVRVSGTDLVTWRRAVARCTGTATAVGLTTGAGVLVAAAVLHGTVRGAFLALGLTLPALLLQDSWRYSFFALGRGIRAFLNDTIWALTLVPALVLVRATGHMDVFWFVLAWGVSAAVAAAAGPFQAGVIPKLTGAWTWLWRHRDLGPRYFAEGGTWSAVSQLRTYGIGLILGLAALGYVQAANTLMGPLTILFLGMSLVAVPEAARVLRDSPRRLPLFCVLISGCLAALALAWGLVLLVALPKGLGAAVLGPIWRHTYPLVLLQALFVIAQGAGVGSGTGLHALGAARRSLRGMVLISATYLVCSLVGAAADGTIGTMRGAAVAAWIGVLISWWQFRAALRESEQVPMSARLWPGRPRGRHRNLRPAKSGSATKPTWPPPASYSAPSLGTAEISTNPPARVNNFWPSKKGSATKPAMLPPTTSVESAPSTAGMVRKPNAPVNNLWPPKNGSVTKPTVPSPPTGSPQSSRTAWITSKPSYISSNSWPPKIDTVTWSPWSPAPISSALSPKNEETSRKPKSWRRRA